MKFRKVANPDRPRALHHGTATTAPTMLTAFLSLPLALALAPQQSTVLFRRDDLLGQEPVTGLDSPTIDGQRNWFALARFSDSSSALLANGEVVLQDGQRILEPSARVRLTVDPCGGVAQRVAELRLDDFVPPLALPGPRQAIVRNERAVVIAGERLGLGGFPPDAVCESIIDVAANLTDTLVIQLRTGGVPTLVRFRFGADGSLLTSERLLANGDDLGAGRTVASIGFVRLDQAGNWLTRVVTTTGQTFLVGPAGILLGSGDGIGIPGRHVGGVVPSYDLNDLGGWAAWVRLASGPVDDLVLVVDGKVHAQEGQLFRSIDPFAAPRPLLDYPSSAGLVLSNDGQPYWLAHLSFPGAPLLMRGSDPILEPGLSRIDGALLAGVETDFEVSPDGRDWLGVLYTGSVGRGSALVRTDFGSAEPRPGCASNPGRLELDAGLVLAGHTLTLELDGPAPLGALGWVYASTGGPALATACGLSTPFGELLLDPSRIVGALPAGNYVGGPLTVTLPLPSSLALVDRELYLQGVLRAPGSILLSNGLRLEVGAP